MSWEGLATPLGLSYSETQELRYDYHSYSEQKTQLLMKWKRRHGSEATYQALLTAAYTSGDRQFADVVKRVAANGT